jgi:branched-chain amino acid transport system ATP-binding protein
MLLEVEGLSVSYGPVRAVRDVSFAVEAGELVVLLGANGAGKTSVLSSVMGLIERQGAVRFEGEDLRGCPTEEIVRRGMTLSPEGRRIFGGLTVEENLRLAWPHRARNGFGARIGEMTDLFPPLAEKLGQHAALLSGGQQQQLAIARALMSSPKLLLLDEPSLGLAPRLVDDMLGLLRRLRADGVTIVLVEQNARKALGIADRGYVLQHGELQTHGSADELSRMNLDNLYLGISA